jgi:thiamine transporter ThiT
VTTVLIIVGIWLAFLVAVIIMAFAYRRGYKHGVFDGFYAGFLAATDHVLEEIDPFIEAQRRAGRELRQ